MCHETGQRFPGPGAVQRKVLLQPRGYSKIILYNLPIKRLLSPPQPPCLILLGGLCVFSNNNHNTNDNNNNSISLHCLNLLVSSLTCQNIPESTANLALVTFCED